MARNRRKGGRGQPLPLSGREISLLLRALSLFEHAFRHDASERHAISALKRKLHEHLAQAR